MRVDILLIAGNSWRFCSGVQDNQQAKLNKIIKG